MKNLIICTLGAGLIPFSASQTDVQAKSKTKTQPRKPNVLFIVVDDLRPELNCFGATYMRTPNFDRLAAQGTIFQRAYCQQAISAATRNSLLTGMRPDGIGIYDLGTYFRKHLPDVVTLPQQFMNNGYRVEGVGKVYHTGHGNQEDSLSWHVKWEPDEVLGKLQSIKRGDTTKLESDFPYIGKKMLPWYATAIPDSDMKDGRVVEVAIDRMKALKDEPFFMAVGIVKPHLPFVAPKKYWDLYDKKDIVIPSKDEPEGMPDVSMVPFGELRKYYGIPAKGLVSDEQAVNLIHGYRACVSFVDAMLGQLMDALEKNGIADNTIVVLWGDHGWKLGDYGNWCKHSNMEFDTNAPLMISAPGLKGGGKSNALVEFVDVYPTICQLAGLPLPSHLQGTTLIPILHNPQAKVKDVAISQYPRGNKNEIMGYSMRTEKYRYTRWVRFNEVGRPTVHAELYDQSHGKLVDKNLAMHPEYKNLVEQLDKQLTAELAKYKAYPRK